MEKTEETKAKPMPMCETKEILNKLKNLVNDPEPAIKQTPRVLIRSDGCRCSNNQQNKELQNHCRLQTIRSFDKTPPQSFDLQQVIDTENELAKRETLKRSESQREAEKIDSPAKTEIKEDGKDVKNSNESKQKKSKEDEDSENDEKKNIITVRNMCKPNEDKPSEMRCLIKEGKLPQENEEVCTKDPKTGTFTCYTVGPGGRVIDQITDPQPLPEEKTVIPHPILPIPKPSTNFELRGSKLMVGCGCLKRNGMQHDCLRSQCQGKKECLKFPAPVCQPSGLAPPIIKISPITVSIEPECGPRKKIQITKTEMEKRKVLLNYARAQYYQWPPSTRVPCKVHKKGLYYIRPLQKVADAQTDKELLDQYIKGEYFAGDQTNNNILKKQSGQSEEEKQSSKDETKSRVSADRVSGREKTEEPTPRNKIEETLKKLEKDLNMN